MGYYDHRVLEIDQKLLQPGNRIQIQVVGRLIEQKNIRIAEESLGKKNLDLDVTVHISHLLIMKLCTNAKSVQKSCCIRLSIPAVHFSEFSFQLTGTDTILIGKVFLHIDGFLLLHNIVKSLVTHHNRIQNRKCIILKVILFQEGKSLSRCNRNITAGRFELTAQNFQKG